MMMTSRLEGEGVTSVNGLPVKTEQNHQLVQPNLEPNTSEIRDLRLTFTSSVIQFMHKDL
jgi:hypothetical protein